MLCRLWHGRQDKLSPYLICMTTKLMHKLVQAADILFQDMTDELSPKDIGNSFWTFVKSKLLDDTTKKIKVRDFVYDWILKLDSKVCKEKYDLNLEAIKKSKEQMMFLSDTISKMIKYADIPLIDY